MFTEYPPLVDSRGGRQGSAVVRAQRGVLLDLDREWSLSRTRESSPAPRCTPCNASSYPAGLGRDRGVLANSGGAELPRVARPELEIQARPARTPPPAMREVRGGCHHEAPGPAGEFHYSQPPRLLLWEILIVIVRTMHVGSSFHVSQALQGHHRPAATRLQGRLRRAITEVLNWR